MKIIIAGDGKVGSTVARQLAHEGYDLTLIDINPKVLGNSVERFDIMTVQGNCASMGVLIEAGIKEASLLIAVTSYDEVNLLACMTAKGINNKIHTIARIRNPEYTNQIYDMKDLFGLSLAVNPEKHAAVEMDRLLKVPGFLKRETFAKGRVEIVELRVDKNSKLCNKPLADIYGIVKSNILVCAVSRSGESYIPDGKFILKEDDRIFVTATTQNLSTLLNNLDIVTHKVKNVMICGGGRLAYYLAVRLLKSGVSVVIIESDAKRCEELAEILPDAVIINGDASEEHLLESEGIENCDAVVTLTGLDELNIIISIYSKSRGIPHVITKFGHFTNNNILNTIDIGSTISPSELCCNNILRYVRALHNKTGAAISVHSIADGHAEASEFRADEKTLNCGVPLKDIKLKPNILIACITHGSEPEIPNGNSLFQVGDTVLVVTNSDRVIYQLNDIFE